MTAKVVSLRKARIRKARAVIKVRKLKRLEMEMLLNYVLGAVRQLQGDLDRAVAVFREVRK
jgi:hypothetical protein